MIGSSLGTYPVADRSAVEQAVARARDASSGWAAVPVEERAALVGRVERVLVDRLDALVEALGAMTGRPSVETVSGELLPVLETARWIRLNAVAALADEAREASPLFMGSSFVVRYTPAGVTAVISPWNYPFQLSAVPVLTALAAGNAVVLKPSEVTPGAGPILEEVLREAGLPDGVFQVVQGPGTTGDALVRAGPDRLAFTGSTVTGRKVLAAAAERIVPVLAELGGKDPAIVFADAPFERAVAGVAWGAFANAGQVCVSTERCYVERSIYERFAAALAAEAARLRTGTGVDAEIGPLIHPGQAAIVRDHVQDALDKGARALTPLVIDDRFVRPVVIADATHDMRVMTDETFGPVVALMPFDTEDEAVALANALPYGLNASVWTRDAVRGRRVASRLVCGSCAINDVLRNIGNPSTPFGGERGSGFGRYRGPEGLRWMSRTCTIMTSPALLPREPNWFPHGPGTYDAIRVLVSTLYGGGGPVARGMRLAKAVAAAVRRR